MGRNRRRLNTESETAKGWLEGPYTPEEITEKLGTPDWAPCHRFGIDQGKKIRQIDDLSRNFTNACASIPDRVNLDGVDEILAVAKTWSELIDQATRNLGKFHARWQDGTITTHWMHKDFRKKEHQRLNGSTLDLAHAYRQLAVEEGHKRYSVVGVPKDGKTHYYLSHALLFGASANVLNFNRAARALNFCVHKCAGAPVTNFFDDYVLVAPAPIAKFMYKGMKNVLEILGWTLKEDSINDPETQFTGLGVVFEFGEDARTITVKNKKSRMEKLEKEIHKITDKEGPMLLSLAQVSVLRGKMVFSISQIAGRVGAIPLNLLSKHNGGRIKEDLRRALLWWVEAAVHRAKPRTVKVGDERRPILIFTDGAHEETVTGYGGVMIDPESSEVAAFGRNMGERLQAKLSVAGKKKQIIGQAELYPAVVARRLWKEKIHGRDVVHFIDNDSAKFVLIKGTSPCLESAWLIQSLD